MKLYQYVFLACVAFFFSARAIAQSFIGLNHDKNVITEVYDNPAMAMTGDFCQVNVIGFSMLGQNNGYSFNKSDLLSGSAMESGVSYHKLPGTFTRTAWANVDILGPGATVMVRKNFTVGVTTRMRYFTNVDNLSNAVFQLIDNKVPDTSFVYHVDNTATVTQSFAEINFLASGYLYQDEDRSLSAGVGVKLLYGVAGAAIGMDHGQFQMHADNVPYHFKGSVVNIDYTPYANKWLSNGDPLGSLDQSVGKGGLGMDIGFVYSYTPHVDISGHNNGYVFRLSVSVTDIGSIKYPASSSSGSYKSKADSFDINTLDRDPNTTYGQIIDRYIKDSVITQTDSRKDFKIGLSTALRMNADLKISDAPHFNAYINCNVLLNLRKNTPENFSTHYISAITFAPRFMWKNIGFGVPFTFSANKQGFLGGVFYAGPFYIGTSSLGNFLILQDVTAADAYIGMSIRIPTRKKDMY